MSNKYKNALLKLLPTGKAWNKEDSSPLDKICEGNSEEFLRVDTRANQLIIELDPTKATELLPDWEKLLALPDPAFGSPETVQERRSLVVLKFSLHGGQSRQYFIDLIKKLGFDIKIKEHRPFRAGKSRSSDAIYTGVGWRYTWTVQMLQAVVFHFRAGKSSAGDPLVSYRNTVVQGIINKLKPAHTNVIYRFVQE